MSALPPSASESDIDVSQVLLPDRMTNNKETWDWVRRKSARQDEQIQTLAEHMDVLVNTAATREELSATKRSVDNVSETLLKVSEMVDLMYNKMQKDKEPETPHTPPVNYPAFTQPRPSPRYVPVPGLRDLSGRSRNDWYEAAGSLAEDSPPIPTHTKPPSVTRTFGEPITRPFAPTAQPFVPAAFAPMGLDQAPVKPAPVFGQPSLRIAQPTVRFGDPEQPTTGFGAPQSAAPINTTEMNTDGPSTYPTTYQWSSGAKQQAQQKRNASGAPDPGGDPDDDGSNNGGNNNNNRPNVPNVPNRDNRQGTPGASSAISGSSTVGSHRLKKEDISTFNPNHYDPDDAGMVSEKDKIIFTDIYCFVERIESLMEDEETAESNGQQILSMLPTMIAGQALS
ncbi:hypothetical protein EKO27_g5769 [Xylaria grammica]|uniref:Uncharacterized protein n=1 Tax=Xylaria grammica TaxID=363999 RepID=A0A439D4P1_9PEZI|nr:hypothetical protein EKO27_g5769 [Xylaria grammica]